MCLYVIAIEYNGPLEAAPAYSEDDAYDKLECAFMLDVNVVSIC